MAGVFVTRAPMSPATYLAKRRVASGWSQADVDCAVGLRPGFIADLEAGAEPVTVALVNQLRGFIAFNLIIIRGLANGLPMAVCRGCGCSEYDGCEQGCSWVESDLCSACRRVGGGLEDAAPPSPVLQVSMPCEAFHTPAPDLFSYDWTR